MKFRNLFMAFGMSLLLAAALSAQPGRGSSSGERPSPIAGLTAEQHGKIQEIKLATRKEALPLQTKLQALESELKLAITSDSFDESKVKSLVAEMGKIKVDLRMRRILSDQAVRALLTEEQRKGFDMNLLSKRGHNPRGKRGPGKHGPKGRGPAPRPPAENAAGE